MRVVLLASAAAATFGRRLGLRNALDLTVELREALIKSAEIARQPAQQLAEPARQAIAFILKPARQGAAKVQELAGRHQPVLGHETSNLVRLGAALFDQARPDTVDRLDVLLLDALHWHESHARTPHRLADRLGIGGVALGRSGH